ncbi:MAG: hypothetical protein K6F53_12405 [Lachnospiraceae bacterium]|nr:hypothetical protein [Lachnospiraceae bacterium]
MNQKSLKYRIDQRTAEDIERTIEETAVSYTPEWHFSTQDPDIGSTIARIYATSMQENIRAVNNVLDIYHAEFVNLLDLTLKSAVPAGSIVCFKPVDSVPAGVEVPKGTRILTGEGGEDSDTDQFPAFETDRNLYVTVSDITDAFLTDREADCIVPVLGKFDAPELYAEETNEEEEVITGGEETEEFRTVKPFVLFGERESIGRHALLMYHPAVFDVSGEKVFIRISGNAELCEAIARGDYRFSYLSAGGLVPYEEFSVTEDPEVFLLIRRGESKKTSWEEEETPQDLVVLEAVKPVNKMSAITDIRLSSAGDPAPVDYVGDDGGEMNSEEFEPFGDTLSLFEECYIGKDSYFEKPGARVTLDFHLTFGEHAMEVSREKEESELKIIKRKARAVREQVVTDAYVDEISLEYFNGIGWKRLNTETEIGGLFSGETPGQYSISFRCPDDWAESENGAYQGHLLRLRLLKSDNCYLRPAIHHYPVITGLKVSYTYRGGEVRPSHLRALTGTAFEDLTSKSRGDEPYPVFSPLPYTEDALYLGFDRKIEGGPVGILFRVGGKTGRIGVKCRFEYSSRRGFRQFKAVDGTEDFSRSGILLFVPPADFHAVTIEGKRRYWIRIVRDRTERPEERVRYLPFIEDFRVNAMTVTNTVTGEEEDFYLDEAQPNMHFFLGATNILDAEVWVNEREELSGEEMRVLLREHPEDVRTDYDLIGNISACYVRWHETEQFELPEDGTDREISWQDKRVYRIDRLTGEILFGDGIHVKIPRVTDDVAFRVRLRTCAGEDGNIPADTLNTLEDDFLFLDTVSNPVRAFGGSNMETVQQALLRGADRIHSRGRLVSMGDFKRAILRYSGVIDKVGGVTGLTTDGREDPAELTFVLLMKDYADGSFSFHRIEAALTHYLLSACEITVAPQRLHIVEPIFVEVSVNVWTQVMNMDDSFEVQNQIRDTLNRYLNPVSGGSDGSGWEIGVMPKRSQIQMQISAMKCQALIKKTSITARFTDWNGDHEMNYGELTVNPFMVCVPGEHQVHILYDRSEKNAEN